MVPMPIVSVFHDNELIIMEWFNTIIIGLNSAFIKFCWLSHSPISKRKKQMKKKNEAKKSEMRVFCWL